MAEGHILQTEAAFNLCVENISKLNTFWSPQVMIRDIPWKFNIKKHVIGNEEWLAVFLYCNKKDKSRDWAIVASATFELVSFDSEVTCKKSFAPCFFDYMSYGNGFPKFIKWKDLFDIGLKYGEKDTIHFNIKVEMSDQNNDKASKLQIVSNKCCEMSNQMTLQLTVNNIRNLMAVRTSEFVLQNFHWDLTVFKWSGDGSLCLRLRSKNESNQTPYNVKIDLKMKSSVEGVRNIEKSYNEQLQHREYVNVPIISWDELFKPENGFIENDSIQFEVKIKVDKVDEVASNANKRRASSPADGDRMECPICLKPIKNQGASSTVCGHLFCSKCIENTVKARGLCPSCNAELDINKVHRVYLPL